MSTDEQMKKIGERIRAARARLTNKDQESYFNDGSGNVANPHAVIDELKKAAEEYTSDLEKYNVRTANGFKIQWSGLYSNHDIQVAFLVGAAHAQRWIPVSERLPEQFIEVLWFSPAAQMRIDYIEGDSNNPVFHLLDRKVLSTSYTHWLPLPPAPKGEE